MELADIQRLDRCAKAYGFESLIAHQFKVIMNIWYRIKFWFFDTFGKRDIERTYTGYNDWIEKRGWWFRNRFVYYDE